MMVPFLRPYGAPMTAQTSSTCPEARGWHGRVAVSLAACTLAALPAAADPVADFYRNKTVSIVVGHQVGTGFDTYARVLARHMGRHIPGGPNMIVQGMVGASGITAANWLYNVAPKDGTAMGAWVQTVPLDPLMGGTASKFDAIRFNWIGNLESSVATCVVTQRTGIKSFEDLRTRETLFGSTGGGGALTQFTLAARNVLGAKVRLVSGYKGAADIGIAMQRGEIEGMCGANTSFLTSFWGPQMDSGEFKAMVQLNGPKRADLAGIAHASDLARTQEDKQVLDLVYGPLILGRIYAAPPDLPADRVKALRDAFNATARDAEFLADAEKTKLEISPMTGEEVAEHFRRYYATPKPLVERAIKAVRE
jgi:tripartite-type tricarboxylate transporter receptor subunit TctC